MMSICLSDGPNHLVKFSRCQRLSLHQEPILYMIIRGKLLREVFCIMNIKGSSYVTTKAIITEAFGEEKWNAFKAKVVEKDKFFNNVIMCPERYLS